MKSFLRLFCILALLCAAAHGATIYQAGSKNGCSAFANEVQSQIQATHAAYPADWRIIVACTDGE